MRTTLNIDSEVLSEFKRRSAETHQTLSRLIENALREYLSRGRDVAATKPVEFPIVGGHGLTPGVELFNSSGLADYLYGIPEAR